VIKASEEVRESRLGLVMAAKTSLEKVLELLGISAPQVM
jgi:arginyl-tRNA synthetase